MDNDKKLNEMDDYELADMLIEHPEKAKEILDQVDDLDAFYILIHSYTLPYDHLDSIDYNQKITKALEAISGYEYSGDTFKELTEEKKEALLEEIDGYINLGYTPDKLRALCAKKGYDFNQLYDDESLKARYADFKITYDIENHTISSDWFDTRTFQPFQQKENKIENNRYENIDELIAEVDTLGDWKDINEKDKFFKILSKISIIQQGYYTTTENGEKVKKYYPEEVIDAIIDVCSKKFPKTEQVFDENDNYKPGCPDYANYLPLVEDRFGINILGQRTNIAMIAEEEYNMDIYNTPATENGVKTLIESSKEYLEKSKIKDHNKSELEKKDAELSTLEAEEKEISKAEKVISDKKNRKGQDIGEE